MEIGKINDKPVSNTVGSTRSKVEADSFEKKLKNALDKADEKQLKKVCSDFEGIFLNMMYRQMKSTVPQSELIPGDAGRDVFQSMLDDKLMEGASQGQGIGLADVLYKQLSKQLRSTYKPNDGGDSTDITKK